jgi:hypothetical protein
MIGSGASYLRLINKFCSEHCMGQSSPVKCCKDESCPFYGVRNDRPELTLYGYEQRDEFLKEAVAFVQERYLAGGRFEWSKFRKEFNKRPWHSSWFGSPLTGKLKVLGWRRTSEVSKSKTETRKGGTSFVWEHINRAVSEAA